MEIRDNLHSDSGWNIVESQFDSEQLVVNGSNFMTGNGYLGYRGTFPEWRADRYVGCVVTDTWDNADGKWKELCTVPNALYLVVADAEGERVFAQPSDAASDYRRELDFRYGVHRRAVRFSDERGELDLVDERFASYDNLHLVPARMRLTSSVDRRVRITSGVDAQVWSLNGDHFSSREPRDEADALAVVATTQEQGIRIAVAGAIRVTGAPLAAEQTYVDGPSVYRELTVDLPAGETVEVHTVMVVVTSRDSDRPEAEALETCRTAADTGYDALFEAHRTRWDESWAASEILIDGDERAQTLLRYNMYQNMIATPAHSDRLPIGARGLSCQAYQGAAFWDQEIFNLPMFLYTRPEVARNILTYRHKTLDGARRKARDLGFRGAFYAWVSADTGEEVCPSYFFVDVLTGRPIHNHFNDWQIHVSPDVAYTVWKYYESTGDFDFIVERGAEIVFEVMRFLATHAYFKPEANRYEFVRLLGPDEYHENVDNNFFTNYQARYVARLTRDLFDLLADRAPQALARLTRDLSITDEERALWDDMANRIHVPEPDPETGLIEQFRGFFELEDILPDELAKRLKDPSEYWGWPNGIAVETQVSKQADVTQLFALHPHAYPHNVMRANYDYYEPRTQHGSSLSHSVYSMVAAWIGETDEAYRYFVQSLSIDLMNANKAVSGGTFIGGIHTAACGVSWQIAVHGLAGTFVTADGLQIEPRLPGSWKSISFPFVYRGNRARIAVSQDGITVEADEANGSAFHLIARGTSHEVAPGQRRVI